MKFPGLKRADESFWIRHFHTVLIYGFLLVLCILASILDKNFLTGRNFRALIITALPLMFVSFGQSCAVMTHGLDTSLGAIVSLTNVLTVALMRPGEPFGWVLAVLAGLVAGGLMIFAWKFCVRPLGGIWDIYELMPAFIVNCIVLVVVSLATPAPDKSITDVFDKVRD